MKFNNYRINVDLIDKGNLDHYYMFINPSQIGTLKSRVLRSPICGGVTGLNDPSNLDFDGFNNDIPIEFDEDLELALKLSREDYMQKHGGLQNDVKAEDPSIIKEEDDEIHDDDLANKAHEAGLDLNVFI